LQCERALRRLAGNSKAYRRRYF